MSRRPPVSMVMLGVILAALLGLVLYPLGTGFIYAFAPNGNFDLGVIGETLADPELADIVLNTLVLTASATVLALVIAALLAWVNERTDARIRLTGDLLPIVPLLIPALAGVIGWVALLAPNAGVLNVALRAILRPLGLAVDRGPIDIYSFPGMIFVATLYVVPYAYLALAAAFRNHDSSLDEAARVSGASPLRTLRQITLPASMPSLVAAATLVTISCFTLFSIPLIIGTQARIDVMSVHIFRLVTQFPSRPDVALVLAVFLIIPIQFLIFLQSSVSRSGRHATVGGRGARSSRIELGRWRRPARILLVTYFSLAVALPILALVLVSLQTFWSPNIRWDRLNLANFEAVLVANPLNRRALINSVILGAATATIAMFAAALVAVTIRRSRERLGRLIDGVVSLPATIPHTVIGVSFLLAFSGAPFGLHGTLLLLVIAYLAMYMPQATRTAVAAAAGVSDSLTEAAALGGDTPAKATRRILFPLMLPGLLAGWVIVFVLTANELTASVLLSGAGNPVLGVVVLDLWVNHTFPNVAALALVMTLFASLIVTFVRRLSPKSIRVGSEQL